MAFDNTVVVASAARTTTGNSGALSANGSAMCLGVNVSAASGTTPSMTLTVEWSFDGVNFGPGETAVSFAAITANKATTQRIPAQAPFYRLVWTITGTTPSFTFSANAWSLA
jgi:hypothetical protein